MTLVNIETGEIVEPMAEDAARRLTERIRIAATNYTEAKAKVLLLVDEAKAGQAHISLGYRSWTAYLSDVLSDEPLRLARDDRRELAVRLADEGMSTRAIAPIVGAGHVTVARDIAASTVPNETVDGSAEYRCDRCGGVESIEHDDPEDCNCGCDPETCDRYPHSPPTLRPIPVVRTTTGLDGRERTTATARGRLRQEQRPDAEVLLNLVETEARKAATTAAKITADQIGRVKPKADLWTVGLRESVETLQRLLTSLESENK